MNRYVGPLPILLFLSATIITPPVFADDNDPKGLEFFEKKIRPVLVKQCYSCHSSRAKEVKGNLLLDSRAGSRRGGDSGHAVVPGNVEESLLIDAIRREENLVSAMPPDDPLPDEVVADFVKWVKMGAPDPRSGKATLPKKLDLAEARKFWAFQPPKKHPAPEVKNQSWPKSDIDRFLLAKLEQQGLKPTGDAARTALIRRVTFDLTGLPPTPTEVETFLKDKSPQAFETVVERLLSSPRFGEHWGRHWLDVARFAESSGKERNYAYLYAWRYRDYVIDSFNKDKPYNRFVQEQLAGDLLPTRSEKRKAEQLVATGFLTLGPKSLNERDRLKYEMDQVDDQIDTTGRAFLGLTVGCARCHDHKFDPIPTRDYYALAGIFRSTDTLSGVSMRKRGQDENNLLALASEGQAKKFERHSEEMDSLQSRLSKVRKSLKKLQTSQKKKKKNKQKSQTAKKIAEMRSSVKQMQEQLARLEKNAPPAPEKAMGVRDEKQPADSELFIRGDVDNLGDKVPRGFVSVITADSAPDIPKDQSGRRELARWIASRNNPLTARVMVNRIWQHLFGEGLVATVDNFGSLGTPPSHPQLLDYLAVRFMDEGWSVKKMIREIVLTRVYQLDTAHIEQNYAVDPDNRFLWRMSRRRLNAESIRDAVLAVSGELDVKPPKGSPVTEAGSREIGRQINANRLQLESNHRSVYLPVLRNAMPDMLQVFDVADPSLVVGHRDVTTAAPQALYMMNSPFVLEQADYTAKRLLAEAKMSDADRVELAYKLALSHAPDKTETGRVLQFIKDYRDSSPDENSEIEAWSSFCQALFASAEFRYVY